MPASYWGVTDSLGLAMPRAITAWLLLALYALAAGHVLYRGRSFWSALARRQRLALAALCIAGFAASRLLPISFSPGVAISGTAPAAVALLSAVPYLLAGLLLGPVPALLTGAATGLGRAIGGSGAPAELFHFAFAAWLAALLLRQQYHGRLFRVLRAPPLAGVLGSMVVICLTGLSAFAAVTGGFLLRFDAALQAGESALPGLLLEGLAGGIVLALLLLAAPEWRPRGTSLPAPGQRTIHDYLVTNVLLFGLASLLVTTLFAFTAALLWSTRLHAAELSAAAHAATLAMNEVQQELETTLLDLSREDGLLGEGRANARTLGQSQRAKAMFEQVLFVDTSARVLQTIPAGAPAELSNAEQTAVAQALALRGAAKVHSAGPELPAPTQFTVTSQAMAPLAVVVQRQGALGEHTALVGRVAPAALRGALGAGGEERVTAVLTDSGAPLLQAPQTLPAQLWQQAALAPPLLPAVPGTARLVRADDGARSLVFLGPAEQAWRVGVAMPYTTVLAQALLAALPLTLLLLALTGAFAWRTTAYGRALSGPLAELAGASRSLAAGGTLAARRTAQRQDEIGELDRAFADMERALQRRLDELSLLLTVSQKASANLELAENMPVVLQGALRGSGAAAARAVILNPNSGYPLSFAQGMAAPDLAALDRPFMAAVREQPEIILRNAEEVATFDPAGTARGAGFSAYCVLRLGSAGGFQGFLLLAFRRADPALGPAELALLRTLAGQASLLIDKSYLFANAEGGRRRLAAVLASTAEAVIVTDQTLRILMVNRSFEKAFGVQAAQVAGRSIHDVIPAPALVAALAEPEAVRRDVEVEGRDRRIYFANASPINSHDGQILGRVAVLHDITHLKELDRVKSEFVDNVSHDLRTPLTVLSGYATALAMLDDLTPEQRDYSEHIVLSVERMVTLVENLLDLGRIEAGVDFTFEEIAVPELLQALAGEQLLYARESGVALRVYAAPDLPPLQGDRLLLHQALANLLGNAFKYAPDSGEIVLRAEQVGDELVFSVADKGPGIAGQDQIRLFEKFYRVKRHGAGKAKGSGLGLAIVRSIAERHHGRAWCASELGQGSTFYLAVPLTQPTSD